MTEVHARTDVPFVILVDDHEGCTAPALHAWPWPLAFGRPCRCGAYALLQTPDGDLAIVPLPSPNGGPHR